MDEHTQTGLTGMTQLPVFTKTAPIYRVPIGLIQKQGTTPFLSQRERKNQCVHTGVHQDYDHNKTGVRLFACLIFVT